MLLIILVFTCYYAWQAVPLERKNMFMKNFYFAITLLAMLIVGCAPKEQGVHIEASNIKVTANEKSDGVENVRAILERNKAYVDSIKSPVLGEAAVALDKYVPESPLMNFAADALFEMAQRYSKEKIDIAITNKGGLRSNIAAGTITFGDVYNVFTFENTLAMLTLNGEQLWQLCSEIAAVGGEAIAGMRLVITEDGKLVDVTVGGEPLNDLTKEYRVATSDYLSQGNDKMTALALGTERHVTKLVIRDLMVEYIKEHAAAGKKITAECDGRITIKE